MRTNIALTQEQQVELAKQSITGIVCGLDRQLRDSIARHPENTSEHKRAKATMEALQKLGYAVNGCQSMRGLEAFLAQTMLGHFKPESLDQSRNTLIHHQGCFVVVIGDDTLEFISRVKTVAWHDIDARIQGICSATATGREARKHEGWNKRDHLIRLRDQISSIKYPFHLVEVKRYLMVSYEEPEQFARALDASSTVEQMVRTMVNRVQFGTPVAV